MTLDVVAFIVILAVLAAFVARRFSLVEAGVIIVLVVAFLLLYRHGELLHH